MSMFITKHPIITLMIIGVICQTVVDTADVIVNGRNKTVIGIIKEKKDEDKNVEVVEGE